MDFREPQIEDYERLQRYFSSYGENSCQHSFVNLFTLCEKYGSRYCELDGFLYVLRSSQCDGGFRTYLFPFGEGDRRRAVSNIFDDAHRHGARVRFATVTEEKCGWLLGEYPGVFDQEEVRDYAEYIHLYDNLANLPGKPLKRKRLEAAKVRSRYGERLVMSPITRQDIDELLAFERNWINEQKESHDGEALELEYREMEKQLEYMERLNISGTIARIDGRIEAFVYGAPISDECYDLLVEKGSRSIQHICRALEQDSVKMCAKGYKYINREEDVGVPGLRQSKLTYRPDILLKKFIVTER